MNSDDLHRPDERRYRHQGVRHRPRQLDDLHPVHHRDDRHHHHCGSRNHPDHRKNHRRRRQYRHCVHHSFRHRRYHRRYRHCVRHNCHHRHLCWGDCHHIHLDARRGSHQTPRDVRRDCRCSRHRLDVHCYRLRRTCCLLAVHRGCPDNRRRYRCSRRYRHHNRCDRYCCRYCHQPYAAGRCDRMNCRHSCAPEAPGPTGLYLNVPNKDDLTRGGKFLACLKACQMVDVRMWDDLSQADPKRDDLQPLSVPHSPHLSSCVR